MRGNSSPIETRYRDRLKNFPVEGEGRHFEALAVANLAAIAGIPAEHAHADIRDASGGSHPLPDREIQAAVQKAFAEHQAGGTVRPPPKPAPIVKDGQAVLRKIIAQGSFSDEADFWETSPVRLNGDPSQDTALLLQTRFNPGDLIFIGNRYEDGIIGRNIRAAAAWIEFFKAGRTAGPFIIVNPFTGKPAPKKSGDGETYRGDRSVAAFRHCLIEFDNLSREDQLRFWSAARLPIVALIDSGGKSIHAWLDVEKLGGVSSSDEWTRKVKSGLYEQALIPMGVDRACCNQSRLSRLPGCVRTETGKFQRLIWLSPTGRKVAE